MVIVYTMCCDCWAHRYGWSNAQNARDPLYSLKPKTLAAVNGEDIKYVRGKGKAISGPGQVPRVPEG